MTAPIILASASHVRRRLLEQAGIPHEAVNAGVDEASIKESCRHGGDSVDATVHRLAEAKAVAVSARFADKLVIGADQILECEGRWFDKPDGLQGVRRHLEALRGRTHYLVNGTVVMEGGQVVWHHGERVAMTMRNLSDSFITSYLDNVGAKACNAVGGYQMEALGAQLFEQIGEDYFGILGLPLLPLMDFLRQRGVLDT